MEMTNSDYSAWIQELKVERERLSQLVEPVSLDFFIAKANKINEMKEEIDNTVELHPTEGKASLELLIGQGNTLKGLYTELELELAGLEADLLNAEKRRLNNVQLSLQLLESDMFSYFQFKKYSEGNNSILGYGPTMRVHFNVNDKVYAVHKALSGMEGDLAVSEEVDGGIPLHQFYSNKTYIEFLKDSHEEHKNLIHRLLNVEESFQNKMAILMGNPEFVKSEKERKIVKSISKEEYIEIRNNLFKDYVLLQYYITYLNV